MIDKRISHVIVFKNGTLAVCDGDGQQITECQGNVRRDPTLIGRVRAACGPGVEWIGTEHLTLLSSPLVDWTPPPPPGHSTQEQRDAWRMIVNEAPEMEAARSALTHLLAEIDLLHTELRVAKFERDEISKRSIVDAVGYKTTAEKLEKITAERDQLVIDCRAKNSFVDQLFEGLGQCLPPMTPRTVDGVVAAVRQLRDTVDGDRATAAAEKNARTNAAFQKFLQIGSAVAAKIGVGNDGAMATTKLKPGHVIIECQRCYLRYETPQHAPDSLPCPHCSDAHVGVGRSLDDACDDVLRRSGEDRDGVWVVDDHRVHVAKVGFHVVIVHMVRLIPERADAG
jgi:hypothetical protein